VNTRADLFGGFANEGPATAGSYGIPPQGFRLPGETRLGPVKLQVADLGKSLSFYESVLGLRTVAQHDGHVSLGVEDETNLLVQLIENRAARPATRRGKLGLFHFAILLPDRVALGAFMQHLFDIEVSPGAADHLVSEALYLYDPDGLGIEVYADRPRDAWRRQGRELQMSSDPLDLDDLAGAAKGLRWAGMPAGTVMGHVHLHVGDLEESEIFFSEALGFDRTVWSYPGALFLAAGGYHHHLGTNIWAGPAATRPGPVDARLLEWTIEVPDDKAISDASASLAATGYRAEPHGGELVTEDPWGTAIRLRAATTRAISATAVRGS
jgi:catechol 2,3-dioxygenase